jgi:hypothetical protein
MLQKTMLQFLLLLLTPACSGAQASQDSFLIYNAYKSNIETLKHATDYQQWYKLQDSLDLVTACAFRRLGIYNKSAYKPVRNHNREGFGEAFYYPAPSRMSKFVPAASSDAPKASAYTIVDNQTKFITKDDGKTKIPYIERLHFDEDHHLLKIDKIDPAKFDAGDLVVYVE